MAKKTSKKSAKRAKSAKKVSETAYGKRTLIKPKGDARFIRRDPLGRIRESDDMGRSLKQDRRKKSKKVVASGMGDKGDRPPRSKKGMKKG